MTTLSHPHWTALRKKNTRKETKKQKKATNRMQIIIEQDMPQLRQGTEDTRREEGTQMMYEGSMA